MGRALRTNMPHIPLAPYHTAGVLEAGIDEAGRGPLFGRVYAAVVILPQDDSFPHHIMKDSKRFTSRRKLEEAAEIVKNLAVEWAVEYAEATEIDEYNILHATHRAMHRAIDQLSLMPEHILVDGDRFKPYWNNRATEHEIVPHACICKGDNTYTSIAAAGILAKVARDNWIDEVCTANPTLDERYGLLSNKGYGTARHMDGLRTYGPTTEHRMSYAPCSKTTTPLSPSDNEDNADMSKSKASAEEQEEENMIEMENVQVV